MVVHAKNYEIVSTFVKVLQKKTVAAFFRTQCMLVLPSRTRNSLKTTSYTPPRTTDNFRQMVVVPADVTKSVVN